MNSPDAVIVGAGIVGAACAYYLASEGVRVRILDAGFAGGGTTSTGMGHVVVMDDSPAQLSLTAYSRSLWDELIPHLPPACEADECGTLWLAEDDEQMEIVRAKHDVHAAYGVPTEILDADCVAECEPNLRRPLAGALRVPGDIVVYPPAVVRWLLDRAVRHGAELLEETRVESISAREVRSGNTTFSTDIVINAAGTHAPSLTRGLPVAPRKGHLVITDRYPAACRHQLVELGYLTSAHGSARESVAFNVQPRSTGQLLIGSSREMVGWDGSVNRSLVGAMLRRAVEFIPSLNHMNAIRVWTGFRPATPDKLPLIGRWGDADDGVWVAAGHEGLGITTSLGTGKILADLILGRSTDIDAVPFDPGRAVVAEVAV